jgi:ubiquinone/menaquinone biosynthesis C-methylase UbiE
VSYQESDIAKLPFDEGSFDLVWSSRTIHHLPDQLAAVGELARVLKTGGWLALREGPIRTKFLPDDIGLGDPGLDDRLDVAFHRWFASNVRGEAVSVRYPFGWTKMLSDAGLKNVTAKTFMLEALAPFDDVQISYMSRHLKRWIEDDERKAMLMPGDAEILEQITSATSEHFVFGREDLYLQEAVTVFAGHA